MSSTLSSAPADQLLIAVAQLNPVAGDIAGNVRRVREARALAGGQGAELLVFPELFLSGGLPRDRAPAFIAACRGAVEELARDTGEDGPALLIGAPWDEGGRLYNAALLLDGGAVAASRFKVELPDVGDERGVFTPGPMPGPMAFRGVRLGVPLGEDIAAPDVAECLMETGAEILLVPSASPYHRDAQDARLNRVVARVVESGLPLAFVNRLGGQGEAVFDGGSFVLNADRSLAVQLPNFQERVRITRWERWADGWRCEEGARAPLLAGDEADYAAGVLSLRDQVEKSGARGALLALSADRDSALAAVMAVDALGPERVRAVALPFDAPSPEAFTETAALAGALGVRVDRVPLDPAVAALEALLTPLAGPAEPEAAAALACGMRGALLTALAERLGARLVTPDGALRHLDAARRHALAALRNRWKPAGALGPEGPVIPAKLLVSTDAEPAGADGPPSA
ncbi:nitrilase-related carbon-nitrogen hydrolase [Ancylobacter polymorphus]|uniref:Glutamine-dependent NAD(+) synthetase n=1 Tax=Ancylobacter polymorphus TaxID=223390 RepID=A0ABU0BCJ5_9HYPH|nr:nitrilase-related carbon-nitrogen hydrolase [Ancylobacter polymorphus]MDQ0303554.1 NAD+ synthase [Ancylobacter polymorphus]